MIEVIRMVDLGRVDKVLAFDNLPEELSKGITRTFPWGFGSEWQRFLPKDKDGKPYFLVLEYKDLTKDVEKWGEIVSYVKRACSLSTRLLDKVEDMAIPMAPDAKAPLAIEPQDIPVIPIPVIQATPAPVKLPELITTPAQPAPTAAQPQQPAKRRPGRPRRAKPAVGFTPVATPASQPDATPAISQ